MEPTTERVDIVKKDINIHAGPGSPDLGSERGEAGHNVVGPGTQVKTSFVHLYCTVLYR